MKQQGELYQSKVVVFDSQTQIKQMTLREILWSDFQKNGKPPIYESKISEIFGGTKTQIKKSFLNNGINFIPTQEEKSGDENIIGEQIIEIGDLQLFERTQFVESRHLELMIGEYGYKLNELVIKNASAYLIHSSSSFISNHPKLWEELQNNFNSPVAFVFLTEGDKSQIIPQIDTHKLWEDSYNYLLTSLKKWKIDTTLLEKYYNCLYYNLLI